MIHTAYSSVVIILLSFGRALKAMIVTVLALKGNLDFWYRLLSNLINYC